MLGKSTALGPDRLVLSVYRDVTHIDFRGLGRCQRLQHCYWVLTPDPISTHTAPIVRSSRVDRRNGIEARIALFDGSTISYSVKAPNLLVLSSLPPPALSSPRLGRGDSSIHPPRLQQVSALPLAHPSPLPYFRPRRGLPTYSRYYVLPRSFPSISVYAEDRELPFHDTSSTFISSIRRPAAGGGDTTRRLGLTVAVTPRYGPATIFNLPLIRHHPTPTYLPRHIPFTIAAIAHSSQPLQPFHRHRRPSFLPSLPLSPLGFPLHLFRYTSSGFPSSSYPPHLFGAPLLLLSVNTTRFPSFACSDYRRFSGSCGTLWQEQVVNRKEATNTQGARPHQNPIPAPRILALHQEMQQGRSPVRHDRSREGAARTGRSSARWLDWMSYPVVNLPGTSRHYTWTRRYDAQWPYARAAVQVGKYVLPVLAMVTYQLVTLNGVQLGRQASTAPSSPEDASFRNRTKIVLHNADSFLPRVLPVSGEFPELATLPLWPRALNGEYNELNPMLSEASAVIVVYTCDDYSWGARPCHCIVRRVVCTPSRNEAIKERRKRADERVTFSVSHSFTQSGETNRLKVPSAWLQQFNVPTEIGELPFAIPAIYWIYRARIILWSSILLPLPCLPHFLTRCYLSRTL
ncbi:hypothetical protein NM688_g7661 [Phlebia brevispora]|uniref:Uncharacterized protein n=1 Tax=Phlebia brevispora TaxID=194682 RepID=A0ACC1S2M0_9APHY|nr:hypothetical protein NM688_g7661 [Phlebia brevispora]